MNTHAGAIVCILICSLCLFLVITSTKKIMEFKELENRFAKQQSRLSIYDFLEMFKSRTYINDYQIVMIRMYAIAVFFNLGVKKTFSICLRMYLHRIQKNKKVDFMELTDFLFRYLVFGYSLTHVESTYLYNYQIINAKTLSSSQIIKQEKYFFLIDLISNELN